MLNEQEQKYFEEMVEEGVHMQEEAEKIAGQPDVYQETSLLNGQTTLHEKQIKESQAYEEVSNPTHYDFFDTTAIEIIEKLSTWKEYIGFLKGNALKYRLRLGKKPGVEITKDFKKARWYEKEYERVIKENTPK